MNNTETELSPSPTTQRWVLTVSIVATCMYFIDLVSLNILLPSIQSALHASGRDLLWISNLTILLLAALLLAGGALGDRLGRKRVFLFGIAVSTVSALGATLAPTVEWLFAARAAQGIGFAFVVPGSLSLISAFFPKETRGRAIGTWSAVTPIMTIIGPIVAGILADAGLWRLMFAVEIPFGVVAFLLLLARVPESKSPNATGRVDWLGAALATLGLGGIAYGLTEGTRLGFQNQHIVLALATGVLALIGFLLVEWRSASPLLPLSLFRSRMFSSINILTFLLYGCLTVVLFLLPLNLVQVQHYAPSVVGLALLPLPLAITLLARWSGIVADKHGVRLPLGIGALIVALGMLLLAQPGITTGVADYWRTFFPAILFIGMGMGIVVAPLTTAVLGAVSQDHAGVASGVNNAVARAAEVIAVAAFGALAILTFRTVLFSAVGPFHLPAAAEEDLRVSAADFGNTTAPASLDAEQQRAVDLAVDRAFVHSFRLVMTISSVIVLFAAAFTYATVRDEKHPA